MTHAAKKRSRIFTRTARFSENRNGRHDALELHTEGDPFVGGPLRHDRRQYIDEARSKLDLHRHWSSVAGTKTWISRLMLSSRILSDLDCSKSTISPRPKPGVLTISAASTPAG